MNIYEYTKPRYITFDLTDRCQMKCTTCSKWKTTPEDVIAKELSTDEWKKVILDLKNWIGTGFTVCFSGGEPFLRQDIFELANFANTLDIKTAVITNGFGVENLCEKIANSAINAVHFSLNSINNPSIHDTSRGRQGSFEKVIKSLGELKRLRDAGKRKLSLGVSTIIMPENLLELIPLVNFVTKNRIGGIIFQLIDDAESFHGYFYQQGCNTSDYSMPDKLKAKYFKMRFQAIEILNHLIQMKTYNYPIFNSFEQLEAMKIFLNNPIDILNFECNTANINYGIDPYGNTRLCFNMNPIGNIRETSPEDMLLSEKAQECRYNTRACTRFCRLLSCNCKQNQ